MDDALLVVEDFNNIMTILYPDEESFMLFQNLLKKYKPLGLKIHDYEILSIGLANGINTIAIFNEKDFKEVTDQFVAGKI